MTEYCDTQPFEKLGEEGALYVNTDTCLDPTWFEIKKVQNVNIDLTSDEVEASSRANDGWRVKIQGMNEWGAETDMIHAPADAGYALMHRAFYLKEALDILILDGDIQTNGSFGYRGFASVTGFSETQELESVMTNAVTVSGRGKPLYVYTDGGELYDVYADES